MNCGSLKVRTFISRRMMSIAAVAVNTAMTVILMNIHTSIRMASFAIVAVTMTMAVILTNIHTSMRMASFAIVAVTMTIAVILMHMSIRMASFAIVDVTMTMANIATAAATMTTAATLTNMRAHITPPGIRRTASVNSATHMRNTAISAAKALPTAGAICLMPTVKRKFIF